MLDLKFVRENVELVNTNIKNKNEHSDATQIIKLDEQRRNLISEGENLKSQRNNASKEIANLKAQKQNADTQIAEMKTVSDRIKEIDEHLREIEENIQNVLMNIPNMLHTSVPVGKSAEDNFCVRQ